MDLPSAALGAAWLATVEAVAFGLFYLWHQRAPIRKAKRERYRVKR